MSLRITYRGSLDSCNYGCDYCPFSKREADKGRLSRDHDQLQRFGDWVARQQRSIRLLFTPWGEALIWPYYQNQLERLSQLDHVRSVTIQTNLSGKQDWLVRAKSEKIVLWATFHPSQTNLDKFVKQCLSALVQGARLSVGIVGLKENLGLLPALRDALPTQVYIWVNAYKDQVDYYRDKEIQFIKNFDAFFDFNLHDHASRGRACHTGESAFTVDGDGNIRRCHFIEDTIGNIYDYRPDSVLQQRPCTAAKCECYIGYIHLKDLAFRKHFGPDFFERYRTSNTVNT